MSEIRDPEKKPEKKNDRDFISEKIVRPAPSRKQVGTRMATAACAGVIFGICSLLCADQTDSGTAVGRKPANHIRYFHSKG